MTTLINGVPCETISIHDRGLLYGDGIFRTLLLRAGKLQQWSRHYLKLLQDCAAIKLPCPSEAILRDDLALLTEKAQDAVVKLTITRGAAARGYTPPSTPNITRILTLSPIPSFPDSFASTGVHLHLCQLRLSSQPYLAGVKHLNRMENVLAASEWNDPEIAEGLLLDETGNVIEGVRSNIFMIKNKEIFTPDLSRSGVAGVQRQRIIDLASKHATACTIKNISLAELLQADEIFLTNSVIGLWPVRKLASYDAVHHLFTEVIKDWLLNDPD